MKAKFLLFGLFLWSTITVCAQQLSTLTTYELTCAYINNPLGIDDPVPVLAWKLRSPQRNQHQSAYEILVSDSEAGIKALRGNQWQSGKVDSIAVQKVSYSGKPLKPFTRYWWRVRVWDAAGNAGSWSAPAWFETAALKADDWKAQWIGDGREQFQRDENFYQDDAMPLFRKTFRVPRRLVDARLYISGVGYYEAYINGTKIGRHVLDPGWTSYGKQVLYSTHDISTLLKSGDNTIGVMLGNGWYNPLPLQLFGRFNLRDVQETGRPCLKAQVLLRYSDGTQETIATDASWLTTTGPVLRNNVYLGEHYDARLEPREWNLSGAGGPAWKPAVPVSGPSGKLTAQMLPPVVVSKVLQPERIYEKGKDTFIVDMGRNLAGVARIKVQGPAGSRVSLRYGEDVHPDGSLNFLTTTAGHIKEMWNLKGGPGAPKTAWQEDKYTLKGAGRETWTPRFTFHGFRYIEITGWPGTPTKDQVDALVMHTDLQPTGTFACSNDSLNRLVQVVQNTFLSNVFSVQSDCPGREKMGYGADIVVTAEAFLYQYDMSQFYRKTVQDFANDQQPDGGITEIAPYTGIADRGYGGHSGPLGWQLAFPFLQKKLYEFYGDRRIIETHYPALQKQMNFLQQKAVNGLFHWDISDHEALDPRPEAFTAAAFYFHHAQLAATFAGVLQKRADSLRYDSLAKAIHRSIVSKYHVPNTGRFDNGTQGAQLFALWYGLAPDPQKSFDVLRQEFERHNNHVSTGIFATKFLFDVMRQRNQNELAYAIATQKGYPGWMHMLDQDATTLWESWKKPDNATSLNHPMFGSILEWCYRSLLGINALAPGFAQVQIKPQPAGNLTWARGSYQSIRGMIGSSWKKEGNRFELVVDIPANTTAEVWVPAPDGVMPTEGGKKADAQPAIKFLKREAGYAVFAVGSGRYQFEVTE